MCMCVCVDCLDRCIIIISNYFYNDKIVENVSTHDKSSLCHVTYYLFCCGLACDECSVNVVVIFLTRSFSTKV